MNTRNLFFLITLFFFIGENLSAQQLNLELPLKETVVIGQEVKIKLKVAGLTHYQLRMTGGPASAVIEGDFFKWTPRKNENKDYLVTFQLMDSLHVRVNEATLELHVKSPEELKPYLVFDQSFPDTIKCIENKSFSFTARLRSSIGSDARALLIYFTYNENPNLERFDSSHTFINGDLLTFSWVPSNHEALQKYAKLRITLIDTDQTVFSQVLNFSIQNTNQKPFFKQEIPDTIYYSAQDLIIDCSAVDPDNDKLIYDYSPKKTYYSLQGTKLILKPDLTLSSSNEIPFPLHLKLYVTDGKLTTERYVIILKANENSSTYNPFLPPAIGDFTKKVFSEGDSVLTYLNISNYSDLKKLNITCTDLNLPPGVNSLAKHLLFEQQGNYIKVYSKGILPYSLVDRDYPYSIGVLISGKDPNHKPAFRVLVITVENRPDPQSILQQKDSLIQSVNNYIQVETTYQTTLEKVQNRINRPWWKTVAIITGTASGVLSIIQSENSDKTISVVSASISLLSILVTNIPSLSEKTVAEINSKIADSKSRIEHLKEKESYFHSNWSIYMDQSDFDKVREDIEEMIDENVIRRKEDICILMNIPKVKRKIHALSRQKNLKDIKAADVNIIFQCMP